MTPRPPAAPDPPPLPHCHPSSAISPTRAATVRRIRTSGRASRCRRPERYGSAIDVWRFLVDHRPELWSETGSHARLVALALLLALPPAVALGVVAARRPRLAAVAV